MIQTDKEDERQMSKIEKIKVNTERKVLPGVEDCENNSSSLSMSIYNLDSGEEGSEFLSNQTPTIVLHNTPLSMHVE